MTKILSSKQIREVDQYTIEHKPIASIDLMENASHAFVNCFTKNHRPEDNIKIFCGTGNNGGDGLAISRILLAQGFHIITYCIGDLSKASSDFKINFERLERVSQPIILDSKIKFPELGDSDIVIDGIFGAGLSRPATGLFGKLIDWINGSNQKKTVAIDIASGLYCDQNTSGTKIIECNHTISFQIPKLAFYLPQNSKYVGELEIVGIGLDEKYITSIKSEFFITNKEFAQGILKNRNRHDHKGTMGRNLIIAGSKGKMGAAVLCAKACLRSGAGLVTTYIPQVGYNIMQVASLESMVITDYGEDFISDIPNISDYDSIGIGPGIGISEPTAKAVFKLLSKSKKPLVLDADALNIISSNNLIDLVPEGSILTPHPGEFERLAGKWMTDFERLQKQIDLSKKHGLVILLKGAYTSISDANGKVYFNSTGNPGMATGGSGDVLTGIITSLMGQGYNSLESALFGAYLHGLAGNLFAEQESEEGLIASDIINLLPKAFSELRMK